MPRPEHEQTTTLGRLMVYAAWILFLAMMTLIFNNLLEKQNNPNRNLISSQNPDGSYEVSLIRNRYGHYVTSGQINRQAVTFLIDTGATQISIPAPVADRLGLVRGAPFQVMTANGQVTVYSARLDRVSIGPLEIADLQAGINPQLDGDEILLGMNFLKHLDMIQRGDRLILKMPGLSM